MRELELLEERIAQYKQSEAHIKMSHILPENANFQGELDKMAREFQKNSANLSAKVEALQKVIKGHNYLEILTYILSNFTDKNSLERIVFAFDCLDGFIDDIEKIKQLNKPF